MPEIHTKHVLYAGPLYLLSPRSQRTFAFYSGLLKCHPLMKDFLTILSIARLITPYPLTLLFSSGHLPGRYYRYFYTFPSLCILHWHAGTSGIQQICSATLSPVARIMCDTIGAIYTLQKLRFNKCKQRSQGQNHSKTISNILYHNCFQNVVQSCYPSLLL